MAICFCRKRVETLNKARRDIKLFNKKYEYRKLTCTCKCNCTSSCTCSCTCSLHKCLCGKDCYDNFDGTINVVFTENMATSLRMDSELRYWFINLANQAHVCLEL